MSVWPMTGLGDFCAIFFYEGLVLETLTSARVYARNLSAFSSLPHPEDKPPQSCSWPTFFPAPTQKVLPVLGRFGEEEPTRGPGGSHSFVYLRLKLKTPDPIFRSLSLWFPFYRISFC